MLERRRHVRGRRPGEADLVGDLPPARGCVKNLAQDLAAGAASAVGVLPAPAERQGVLGQLDEVSLIERGDDGVEVELEERKEGVVGDVSGRDDE